MSALERRTELTPLITGGRSARGESRKQSGGLFSERGRPARHGCLREGSKAPHDAAHKRTFSEGYGCLREGSKAPHDAARKRTFSKEEGVPY